MDGPKDALLAVAPINAINVFSEDLVEQVRAYLRTDPLLISEDEETWDLVIRTIHRMVNDYLPQKSNQDRWILSIYLLGLAVGRRCV